MEMSDKLREIANQAEELKESLWAYMDDNKTQHKGVKTTMNELLDLIDEIDEYGDQPARKRKER